MTGSLSPSPPTSPQLGIRPEHASSSPRSATGLVTSPPLPFRPQIMTQRPGPQDPWRPSPRHLLHVSAWGRWSSSWPWDNVFLSPCRWGFSLTMSGELMESYPVLAFRKFYSLNTTVSYPGHLWGFPGGSDG